MNASDLTKHFGRRWKEKYGKDIPLAYGRAGAFFKRALVTSSAEDVAAHVDFYFTGFVDSFAERTGHSFNALVSCYPAIVAQYQAAQRKATKGDEADRNYARLEAARKQRGDEF